MSNNLKWSIKDLQDKGLAQNKDGTFVPVKSLVAKGKVVKINPYTEEVKQGNKKVKNATKVTENGINFDSKLEAYLYNLLTGAKIDFEFQKVFLLQPKFRYRTENIRAIHKVVDFWLESRGMIIDTKGFSNDISPMKHKMLKYALLNDYGIQPEILMPKNKEECNLLLNRLLYDTPKEKAV